MTNVRKLWILPFLCGIITIIALLTPTALFLYSSAYGNYTEIQWMWGLLFYDLKDFMSDIYLSGFDFIIYAPGNFIPGVIISIVMLSSAIILIISSNSLRKPSRQFTSIKKFWILSGILQITSGIIYIIAMEIGFNIYKLITIGHFVSFWENRIPSFGIIAPIICGALCIIVVIIGYTLSKREEMTAPVRQIIKPKLSPLTPLNSDPQLNRIVESSGFNFCPECGTKINNANSKFCVKCGISLMLK